MPDADEPREAGHGSARLPARASWRPWVWPPALAALAIVLQLLIDVPRHPMVVDDDEPKSRPETKTSTAAVTPRPWKPRGAKYVARLRKSWSKRALADEPIDRRFAERHEDLLRAVVRKAEAAADPSDAPGSVTTRARCHTIRCELQLCAPAEEAEAIFELLPRFQVHKRSLWHELREVDSKRKSDDETTCRRWIVDFAIEGADPRQLRLGPVSKPPQPRAR